MPTTANTAERLAKEARELSVATGEQCPECDSRDTESNGSTEYRCCNCDHRWGTEDGERYGF